ncbi:hypothetical protein NHX12_011855, partial [Muraenolepis orangiensis]
MEDLARSVEQSRCLIIILTPEFVSKRGWSIFQMEPRLHAMLVTGEIKWRGPKSNELSSMFWKQVVYEMPAKHREMLSRRQVALATEIPNYNQMTLPLAGGQMRHFCHSY